MTHYRHPDLPPDIFDTPSSLTVFAIADIHAGATTLGGLSPRDSDGRHLAAVDLEDTLSWFGDLVKGCVSPAKLVLVAGDTYATPRPGPEATAAVMGALARWADDGALVLVLLGNHDRPNGRGASALEPIKHLRPGRIIIVENMRPLAIRWSGRLNMLDPGDPSGLDLSDCDLWADPVFPHQRARTDDEVCMAGPEGSNWAPGRAATLGYVFPVPYPARAELSAQAATIAESTQAQGKGVSGAVLAHSLIANELRKVPRRAMAAADEASASAAVTYARGQGWTTPVPFPPTILFGHGTVSGATWDGYQTVPEADQPISADHFGSFDISVWGHIHKRQQFGPDPGGLDGLGTGPRGYVGSPTRHGFGEEGNPAGVSVFSFPMGDDVGKLPYVEALPKAVYSYEANPHARDFVTLAPGDLCPRDLHGLGLDGEADGSAMDTVWRVAGQTTQEEFDDVAKVVKGLQGRGLLIVNRCKVARPDRARVELSTEGISDPEAMEAALGVVGEGWSPERMAAARGALQGLLGVQ